MSIRVGLCVVCLVFNVLGYVSAHAKVSTIRFEPNGGLVIIPVTVNGQGPFNFLVDTGSSITLLDAKLAAALALKTVGEQQMSGTIDLGKQRRAELGEVEFMGFTKANVPVVILKYIDIPGVLVPVRGVLGENVLDHFDLLIDNVTRTLSVDDDAELARNFTGDQVPLTLTSRFAGEVIIHRPTVRAFVPSYSAEVQTLLLDTGAQILTLLPDTRSRSRPRDGGFFFSSSVTGIGGKLACAGWQDTVVVGSTRLKDTTILVCPRLMNSLLDNDGSIPTALAKKVLICHLKSYVVFNPGGDIAFNRVPLSKSGDGER